jgi:imidazolonepropionase-like amidohydrolase/Tol biopolymer transport system component
MKRILLLALVASVSVALAQPKTPKWDVANPTGQFNYKDVPLSTDEGTWMNLDVSPDGKQIVFDLLGDIYIMPITGGEARVLRSGIPFEIQPKFSPNGKLISFTSDAGGGDNIWVMNTDGTQARQVTKEDFRMLNNASWTPDGNYLIARKHFTSQRSLGAGEMWMYHLSGGSGIQLTKRKNDQQDVNEPTVSPDGRYLYFCEDMYPGGFFQYNKNPNEEIYVTRRYDLLTGELTDITGGPGGAMRPQVSRDGKKLAFVRRVREKTVLYIHDLSTGEERPVTDDLSKDQSEAWAIFGLYPNYAWTPDQSAMIIWARGKIRRIDLASLSATDIPFKVTNTLKVAEALHFRNPAFQETFTSKAIRHAVTSPDGKWLVFNAAGYLWKKELPSGTPQRLTNGADLEFEPAFSSNGSEVVYVTWNDEQRGSVMKYSLVTKGAKPVRVTSEKGIYRQPAFSPDGSKIVYVKEDGNDHQGYTYAKDPGMYWIPAAGGTASFVRAEGSYPQFSQDGKRIIYQSGGGTKSLKSVKPDGTDERVMATLRNAFRLVPSPDGKWVAYAQAYKVYLAALPQTGKPLELDAKGDNVPNSQVARDAGINIHWSGDSKKIHWTLGDEYFTDELRERFRFLDGSPSSLPPMDSTGIQIGLQLKSDVPEGRVAFRGARIVTMEGNEVIEDGVVIVSRNKIEVVGKRTEVTIPAGVKVIEAEGKTIVPGFIDAHAHIGNFRYGLSPNKHWQYYVNLAYGVTTSHDPSSNSEMIFSQREMVRTGSMVGPRIFSTGTILYGAEGLARTVVNNLDDARSAIRRTKAFGAFTVKSYNQPRRDQRQQIIQAAREMNVEVVPEGGSNYFMNMSMVMDGHTSIEHNIPVAPLYKDAITLWGASRTSYTPTLIVNFGGMSGEYYWYQHGNIWENERLLTFTPRSIIDSRARHRVMIPDKEYEIGHILTSQQCKKLNDAGVKVNVGAHGQIQGLGVHWEMWMLAQGGMTPLEVIRAATLNGASLLGMDTELGSIKAGKLADLVVLDQNPLENIQHTNSVRYTMINGRLYDASTMNEVGNYSRPRSKFHWEQSGYSPNFNWHEEAVGCSCTGN